MSFEYTSKAECFEANEKLKVACELLEQLHTTCLWWEMNFPDSGCAMDNEIAREVEVFLRTVNDKNSLL